MLELICPQCQGQLTEVLDSDGDLFICRADFHGKVAPSFTRETLEIAQGIIFVASQPFPGDESAQHGVQPTVLTHCPNDGNLLLMGFCDQCKSQYPHSG